MMRDDSDVLDPLVDREVVADDDPNWIDSSEIYARMEREFRAELAAALPTLLHIAVSRGCLTLEADGVEFVLLSDGRWARERTSGAVQPRYTLWQRILRGDIDTRLDLLEFDELVSWSTEVNLIGAIRRVMSSYGGIVAQAAANTGYSIGGLS